MPWRLSRQVDNAHLPSGASYVTDFDHSPRGTSTINRREWLRIGGLNALGLSLPSMLSVAAESSVGDTSHPTFGRAKNVVFLYMSGGAPQYETFDPKPDAPADIRGSFQPIHTNVPGIDFCELLPRTARVADKLAVLRALSTNDNIHSTSGYWLLTGFKYTGTNARVIQPTDWPHIGSVIHKLKPSQTGPFSFAWLPNRSLPIRASGSQGNRPASWDAAGIRSSSPAIRIVRCFVVKEFELPDDLPPLRLSSRASLLNQVDGYFRGSDQSGRVSEYNRMKQEALGILTRGKAREAFAIHEESVKTRERYGNGKWGQSVLLARRLIEAGVRFVHVNWPREPGDLTSSFPTWDTHAQNDRRVKDVLCPQFDVGFSALIEDLDDRGLLDETLVVAAGEFGRTPKFNAGGGRDHWGPVFSIALAGAGISGGQVYGASDANGAYPHDGRVLPQELAATIFHLLGIGHNATMLDPGNRPVHICNGQPIYPILGMTPSATTLRTATGEVAAIPDFRPIYVPKKG